MKIANLFKKKRKIEIIRPQTEVAIIKRKGNKITVTIPIPEKPNDTKDEEIRIVRY